MYDPKHAMTKFPIFLSDSVQSIFFKLVFSQSANNIKSHFRMDKTWMQELKESPTSMFLLALSAYLVYKIGCDLLRKDEPPPKPLEPLKQDMTLNEVF